MLFTFKCHNRDFYHNRDMSSSRIVTCQNSHNRSGLPHLLGYKTIIYNLCLFLLSDTTGTTTKAAKIHQTDKCVLTVAITYITEIFFYNLNGQRYLEMNYTSTYQKKIVILQSLGTIVVERHSTNPVLFLIQV